jgi:hypothetical protein
MTQTIRDYAVFSSLSRCHPSSQACHHAEALSIVASAYIVMEPPKLLGPPTFVLVQRTLDNPVDAHNHLISSVFVGGMLRRRRSCKKKHLRQILSKAMPKQSSIKLRHNGMPQDKGLHRLKDEMTD